MAGLIKSQIQLGDSATATQNFVLTSAAQDGTMKLSRGNFGATTQDLMVVDAAGKVSFPVNTSSMVRLVTSNGVGSTNVKIRRFLSIITNTGTDITYTDSATLGASFTINTNGVYTISYSDITNTTSWVGISLNSTNTSAAPLINSSASEILAIGVTGAANWSEFTSWTGYLPSGSVIRAHTDNASSSTPQGCNFTIIRVA